MTKKDNEILQAEAFVRNVLGKNFNQKVDQDTLRATAKKVSRAVLSYKRHVLPESRLHP
jgi:hypothetical protein